MGVTTARSVGSVGSVGSRARTAGTTPSGRDCPPAARTAERLPPDTVRPVADGERAAAFCQECLGGAIVARRPRSAGRAASVDVRVGGHLVRLVETPGHAPAEGTVPVLPLAVDDVGRTVERAVRRGGVAEYRYPDVFADVPSSVTVIDPAGYRWLLHEVSP